MEEQGEGSEQQQAAAAWLPFNSIQATKLMAGTAHSQSGESHHAQPEKC